MSYTIASDIAVLTLLLLAANALVIGFAAILEFAPTSRIAHAVDRMARRARVALRRAASGRRHPLHPRSV
jgi:hypothetical protein